MKTSDFANLPWSAGGRSWLPIKTTVITRIGHLTLERWAIAAVTLAILTGLVWAGLRVLSMPDTVPAFAAPDQFSSARAFQHNSAISQVPHPSGSAENARVRDYIVEQIRAIGLQPEIQRTVAVHPEWGNAFVVENIAARLQGTASTGAVLIVGHYDGIASGPGAGDNGVSVASMLEAMRTLQAREPLTNDVIFLFPDAEEYGLVGANVFVEEHPWARDVAVVFNYDASVGTGPLVLMHTAEGDGWLVRNLVAADAGIFLKSQQNSERDEAWGQDFDVFEMAGVTAANLNNWTNSAYYHTRLDNVENLDERKLQAYGASMVQIAQHFGNLDLRHTREGDRVYTSIFDKGLVIHYPKSWTWPLAALVIACVSFALVLGIRRRRLDTIAVAKSSAVLFGFIVTAAVLAEVAWGVITGMHAEARWQQDIDIYQGPLLFGGLVALVMAGLLALLVWGIQRFGVRNLQAAVLVLAIPVIIFAAFADPFFSYLVLWPAFAVAIAVGVSIFIPEAETGRHRWLRAGVFWLAAVPVVGVFAPLLARSVAQSTESAALVPVIAVIFLVALLVSPLDMVLPPRRFWLSGVAVLVGIALLGTGIARYDVGPDQPLPHTLFYTMNDDTGTARWATLDEDRDEWIAQFVPNATAEAIDTDAFLGFPVSAPDGSDWFIPRHEAWVSEAPSINVLAPVLDVLADRRSGDERALRLHVTSPRGARVIYVAPDQEVLHASVEGKSLNTYPGWRFMFVGIPPEGVELELTLRGSGPARFTVLDQTDGLPPELAAHFEAESEETMPAILPRWARGYPAFVSTQYVFE